jgi:hypothetical protein
MDQYKNKNDVLRLVGGLCTMTLTGTEALINVLGVPLSVEAALEKVAINLAKAHFELGESEEA